MSAYALAQGGLRPAEFLPPTLLPNAVTLSAPRMNRRLSLAISCAVYVGCAALAVAANHVRIATPASINTKPQIVVELQPQVVPENRMVNMPPAPNTAAAPVQTRPADWTPIATAQVAPDVTPTALPTGLNLQSGIYRQDMPVGDGHLVPNASNNGSGSGTGHGDPHAQRVVEVDMSQLRVVRQVSPQYPPLARLARVQGPVVLLMTIDAQGVPTDVKAISSPHPALEAESIRTARQWRFEPAMVDGRPVSAQFRLTLTFRLVG